MTTQSEKLLEYAKLYYRQNREKIIERKKIYQKETIDRVRERRKMRYQLRKENIIDEVNKIFNDVNKSLMPSNLIHECERLEFIFKANKGIKTLEKIKDFKNRYDEFITNHLPSFSS
jgi:predicted oxidoreductase